ncbi:MAG: BON domain-containing protein [Pikeienuella sp.]
MINLQKPAGLALGVTLLATTVLSGCGGAGLLLGGAATAGVSVAQERTTKQALTDAEIRLTLGNKLLNEDRGLFADVSTEVVEGRVLLTGEVETPADRIRAAQLVWETEGVVELLNELDVGEGKGAASYAEDVWISTQLRAKLLTDVDVNAINYNVETVGQTVHLIGVARDEQELLRVVEIASKVNGVKEVVSHVLTKHDKRRVRG